MTSYIGLPGALVPISCPASEDVQNDRAFSEAVSFSGRRHVQLGPRVRRSWSIGYGVEHPRDYAVLDALTRWETPLSWVGALAQATNLLTPEEALLDHVGAARVRGALDLGDGVWVAQWATGHATSTVWITGADAVPVRAGVPLTVSAYVQRADPAQPVQAGCNFLDATGASVRWWGPNSPVDGQLQRAVWSVTPPAGAVTMSVNVRYASVVAAPQITWTPEAVPYAPGRGVHRVVVLPGSESPIVAHQAQVLTNAAYTILEVG